MSTSVQDVAQQNEVLFTVRTVFPFDFFPDTIIVDRFKVQINKAFFFASYRVTTVPISETLNIKVTHGLFFAQVHIEDFMARVSTKIEYLPNADATELGELVQGMVIAMKQKASLQQDTSLNIARAAEELGSTR